MRLLELDGVCFNYGSLEPWIFRDLTMSVESGSCHCISGPTGSGKSTLLRLLSGLQTRPFEGGVYRRSQLLCGLVMQDPQVQLLRQTVGAEVAFALENIGVDTEAMIPRVQKALRRVGLFVSLDCPIGNLSLGQKYRLMIAAQLVSEPAVLLLDEPWAQLDNSGVEELQAVIRSLLAEDIAVVMSEHNPGAFADIVSHYWQLHAGHLVPGQFHCGHQLTVTEVKPGHEVILSAEPFEFRYQGDNVLFRSKQPLTVRDGELVMLCGDNGAGKSSLLKAIAGIQSNVNPLPVKVFGQRPKTGVFGGQLGLLMQRPNRQLFESTVIDEMSFSLRRFGLPVSFASELLQQLDLLSLAQRSPHTLSYGQQHLVALASLVCYRPSLLLLDDPLAGLDGAHLDKLLFMINYLRSMGGTVILSSHRALSLASVTQEWQLTQQALRVSALSSEQRYAG